MKFFVIVFTACAAVIATVSAVPGVVNTGHSAQFRSQDSLGNYAFGYNEDHATGGTFRRETGSPGMAEGSYGLRVADGRVRVVNYVADGHGFRANIQTNEPGVEDQDPASVLINKAAAIVAPYIKAPIAAAPMAIQQSIEAPIVQQYEAAPIVQQKYEDYGPAPAVLAPAPAPAPIVQQRYEPALDAAPLAFEQKYESYAPAPAPAPAVISTAYTTKTYASPEPVLSAAGPAYAVAGPAYGPAYGAAGPAYADAYAAAGSYSTKTIAPVGISSAALLGAPIASPALAAKTLGSIGYGSHLIKKK